MKARFYVQKLKEFNSEEEFLKYYEEMIYELVKEAEDLVVRRNAKRPDSVKSCILEIDQKYKSLVRNLNKYKDELEISEENEDKLFIKKYTFFDDGFKAIYVELHKEHSWVFDIDSHKKMIEDIEKQNKERENDVLHLHRVTPYEQLTMDNIHSELLNCLASLGSFARISSNELPINCARPLAYRITLLKYWISQGEINLDDVKEFEKDPERWIKIHNAY